MTERKLSKKGWFVWGVWNEDEKRFSHLIFENKKSADEAARNWKQIYKANYKSIKLEIRPAKQIKNKKK